MAKKEEQIGIVVVKYHITEDLVNTNIPFLRANSRVKPSEGISAVYIDDQPKTTPKSSITFSQAGEHVVKIDLKAPYVIPSYFLWGAEQIYSVEILENILKIEDYAFCCKMQCPPILTSHLKTIGKKAFAGAFEGVDCVRIPDSVEYIGEKAFEGVPHIILGKSVKEWLGYLGSYDEVTIPADNPYVEIRDGFIIEKATNTVQGLMKGAFEDAEDVTIRLPEGIAGFDDPYPGLFRDFSKASLFIPGSVEKASVRNTDCPNIEFAEGVKEISILSGGSSEKPCKIKFPSSLKRLKLQSCVFEELSVSADVVLVIDNCYFQRLHLGPNVVLEEERFAKVFEECKGEVFVEGPIHFDEWSGMENDSVIHVPDEATAERIFNCPEFNKQVKIFVDGKLYVAQEEGAQEKKLLSLLGCPDYPFKLQPIEGVSEYLTLLFNLPKKTTVTIKIDNEFVYDYDYILDDGDRKKLKGRMEYGYNKRLVGKIVMSKGVHVVRLIRRDIELDLKGKMTIEPACETMLISDTINVEELSKNISGVKHLILGAQCHPSEFSFPIEHISVVPENKALEYRDGCIIERETKKLLYAGPDAVSVPSDIADIEPHAFNYFKQERLTIPAVQASLELFGKPDALSQLKELVFEEGFESIWLCDYAFQPDAVVTFPKSLKKLCVPNVTAGHVIVPSTCTLEKFSGSRIDHLEFLEDVTLRPSYRLVFEKFSGHIHFHKGVTPVENFGAPNDDCVITVSQKKLADAIKNDEAFNKNVKVEVKK